ncbi:hypothetical protein CHS0354_042867 [Potamilus streckersoni]|uniref:Fork-head domain-containing protein n=1 Tax=Potamilus streckersoni TaxID=2493646 RepID=A0AAE0T5R0_9BIVA|nr:hypothetical protein CHS0354_042867 [Potamilus streckersoni]
MDNSSASSEGWLIIRLSHSNSRELDSGIQTVSDYNSSNDDNICAGNTQSENFDPVHQEAKALTSCCHSDKVSKGDEKVSVSCDIPDNVNIGNEYPRASTPMSERTGLSAGFDMELLFEDRDYRIQTNTDEINIVSNEQQTGSISINKNVSDRSNFFNQSDLHSRSLNSIPTDNTTFDCNDGKAYNKISDSAITGTHGFQEHGSSSEYSIPPVHDFQERELRCFMTKARIMSIITSVKNPCLIKQENQVCFQKTAVDGSLPKSQYKRYPKPPYTYLGMIVVAIENSADKKLTLTEIHEVLREFFPFFCGLYTGWKNSVRHNLSNNRCFYKVLKDPCDLKCRQHYWRVDLEKVPPKSFCRQENKDTRKGQYALYIHDHLGLPPIQLPSQKQGKLFLKEKRKNAVGHQQVRSNNNEEALNYLTQDPEEPCSHDKKSISCVDHTDLVCSVAEPLSKRLKGGSESDKRHSLVRPVISDEAHQILTYISNTTVTDEDIYSAVQNLSYLCQSPAQYDPAVYAWQASYYQVAHYPVPQVYNGMTPETACVPYGYQMMENSYACNPLPHTISRDESYMYGGHSNYLPSQSFSTANSNPLETFADCALTYSPQQLDWPAWCQDNESGLDWPAWCQDNESGLDWPAWCQDNESGLEWPAWCQDNENESGLEWPAWCQDNENESGLEWPAWCQDNESGLEWPAWCQDNENESGLEWPAWCQDNESGLE